MERIRCGGNVGKNSPSQAWRVFFLCIFLLSFRFFIYNHDLNYEQLANLHKINEDKRMLKVKSYKSDALAKKVNLSVEPIVAPAGKGLANAVAVETLKTLPWPVGHAPSWRQIDHVAHAGAGRPHVVMAMDAVDPVQSHLYDVQQDLIRNQNRAPDSRYNINVTLSDHLPLDRPITDTRPPICQHFTYDIDQLPNVSVIIPFYNEALTMLLRTIHSLLNRTPDKLLQEIILVDDESTDPWLGAGLEHYLSLLPKVKIVRNAKRKGLIVSRMRGARLAVGAVLVFLDAHVEANENWLPPLLDEIVRHPSGVYQPFVDGIDTMTLEYGHSGRFHKGSFSWDLRYTWLKVADHHQQAAHEAGHAFPSPTLVGCAIAVQKAYFFHIGAFDEGLKIWGGENTELGFRVWQCGGKVTTVTCSRVGHVFKEFPYKFDGDKEATIQKNMIRVAETWMDGMRKYFYASTRTYEFKRVELNAEEQASLTERKALRKKLQCKNFEWYMFNIIPEVDIPPSDATYYGEIKNMKTLACWELTQDYHVGMNYVCYGHKIMPQNNFALTRDGLLRYRDKCVKASPPNPQLTLSECPKPGEEESHGLWEMLNQGKVYGQIRVRKRNASGKLENYCLSQMTNVMKLHYHEQMPQIGGCDAQDPFQIWSFTYFFDWDRVPKELMAT